MMEKYGVMKKRRVRLIVFHRQQNKKYKRKVPKKLLTFS